MKKTQKQENLISRPALPLAVRSLPHQTFVLDDVGRSDAARLFLEAANKREAGQSSPACWRCGSFGAFPDLRVPRRVRRVRCGVAPHRQAKIAARRDGIASTWWKPSPLALGGDYALAPKNSPALRHGWAAVRQLRPRSFSPFQGLVAWKARQLTWRNTTRSRLVFISCVRTLSRLQRARGLHGDSCFRAERSEVPAP